MRAFVKIQDGCSLLVPLLRHPARARRHAQPRRRAPCSREIRRRVAQGHREVVLTGINLGCFRDREAGYTLPRLVREAGAVAGLERLRLSSIEVNHVDDELVAALRETPTVGPHLHVPLQSGDDGVLRAMGRRYTAATYLRRLEPLAGLQPDGRRDRRLPRPRTSAAFERTLETVERGRADEGARLPVLAAARARGRRPTTRCRRR